MHGVPSAVLCSLLFGHVKCASIMLELCALLLDGHVPAQGVTCLHVL